MFATRSELLEKIRLGEDSFLELNEIRLAGEKIRGPEQNDLANELAAFANGSGGVLLLGVHDRTREVSGIPLDRLDAVEALVRQACEDSINPPCVATIERMLLPDNSGAEQPVIRVEVPRSLFVHQSPGGYYRRVGSAKRQIPPDQLARLFQHRSQTGLIRFDESPVSWAGMEDLDENLWRRFATPLSDDAPELFPVQTWHNRARRWRHLATDRCRSAHGLPEPGAILANRIHSGCRVQWNIDCTPRRIAIPA